MENICANCYQDISDETRTEPLYSQQASISDRMTSVKSIPHASTPRPQQFLSLNADPNSHLLRNNMSTPNSLLSRTTSIHGNAGSDVRDFSLDDPRPFLTQYEASQTEPWTAQTSFARQDQPPPFKRRAVSQTQSERPFGRNIVRSAHRLPGKSDSGYGTNGFPLTSLSNTDYFSNRGSQRLSDEEETNDEQNNVIFHNTEQVLHGQSQKAVSDYANNSQRNGIPWTSQFSDSVTHPPYWIDDQTKCSTSKVKSGSLIIREETLTANYLLTSRKHRSRQEKAFICEVQNCARGSKGFGTKNDLLRHKKCVHKMVPPNSSDKSYRCAGQNCPKPGKRWPRLDNFVQHLKRVHMDEDSDRLLKEWVQFRFSKVVLM